MHPLRFLRVLTLAIAVLVAAAPSQAQAPARVSISGTILDPDAKAVVEAVVMVRNEATGALQTATTDSMGRFSVSDLQPGVYAIEVIVPGFDVVRRAGVNLSNAVSGFDIRLSVATSRSTSPNNLTDSHAITGVPKGGSAASTSLAPSPNDLLTVMSGRSVSVALTVGVSGR